MPPTPSCPLPPVNLHAMFLVEYFLFWNQEKGWALSHHEYHDPDLNDDLTMKTTTPLQVTQAMKNWCDHPLKRARCTRIYPLLTSPQ